MSRLKKLITIFLSLILIITISYSTYGASETKELFTIDKQYNMAISILFDKEEPIITFTAPDGSLIKGTSLRHDKGEGWVQYYIPNAQPGTWMITYDKLSNTVFDVRYSNYLEPMRITEFSFGEINGDYLPVRFAASSTDVTTYHYELYVVITDLMAL